MMDIKNRIDPTFPIFIAAIIFLTGCGVVQYPKETVLKSGESIYAKTMNGSVEIFYDSPTRRIYKYAHHTKIVNLRVRSDRFLGDLGLYDPAESWIFNNNRLILKEATRSVSSVDKLSDAFQGENPKNWTCNSNGLCIQYWINEDDNIAEIGLYKILVNNNESSEFPNDADKYIIIRRLR